MKAQMVAGVIDEHIPFFAMLIARRWSAFCEFASIRRFCVAVNGKGGSPAAVNVTAAEERD